KGVIDVLNSIIKEKKILVTYVPGNHDLTVTEESVRLILPGINQKRDPELGLGTYSPVGIPEIAIEHGHRYNFFCAPDPISNQDIAPGTITPPGYFFTRLAALHVTQKKPAAADIVPVVTRNSSGNESQDLLFAYWKLWEWSVNLFTITNKFDENIFVTNVDGFTGTFSVNDVLPFQETAGGYIDVNLYKGIQDSWDQRQTLNRVNVHIPVLQAISNAASATETDNQAKSQYFLNPDSDKRIVIFGHSHVPIIVASEDNNGKKCIYANSGTWIDHNPNRTTTHFIVITPQGKDTSTQTFVKLYNFENKNVTLMAQDSLRY
ncbi:MAG TPA: metallophosphoesterase, partial [Rikenellaceae bacterium]|nr:metallophosphoesterase [Rikenellaceae bacterium]